MTGSPTVPSLQLAQIHQCLHCSSEKKRVKTEASGTIWKKAASSHQTTFTTTGTESHKSNITQSLPTVQIALSNSRVGHVHKTVHSRGKIWQKSSR